MTGACPRGSRLEQPLQDPPRGGGKYGLRELPRRAHPTRVPTATQAILPKSRRILGTLDQNCSESSAWPHTPPAASSPPPRTPPPDSEPGTWSAWGLSPREWGEVQSALRVDTPSASLEFGQQTSAAQRSRGPDGGYGIESLPSRTGRYLLSVGARRGATWPGSAAKGGPLDPAGAHYRHDLRHSAGLAGRPNLPIEDAGGSARDAPNPSDVQATPSPSSPEIAAETVARGIALGVSAGLPDHEETGGEENEDAQGIADRPHPADEPRDAQETGAEERAAAEADAEASARAPAVADRPGGSTQHAQGPTNTPASRRQRADRTRTRWTWRHRQGTWEPREGEERGVSAWDAAAAAADDEGTGEDEEVEEHAARIGAAPAQAVTRELPNG
ncbi:unnamed protein product [Closterium sp. NIES-65]|nr:unnamed protein product [Closterium sp. NIES-65]